MNLTTNAVAAVKSGQVNSSSSAGDFKSALQTANHPPSPASVSPTQEKSDPQGKQKKRDERAKSELAAQSTANIERANLDQPKPVLGVPSQQLPDGTDESSAGEISETGTQTALALSARVPANSMNGGYCIPGEQAGQMVPQADQDPTAAVDAQAEAKEGSKPVDALKTGKEDQAARPDGRQTLSSTTPAAFDMSVAKDMLRSMSSKALQPTVDAVAPSEASKKDANIDKPQAVASKTPQNSLTDTPPVALPVETPMQAASAAVDSSSGLGLSGTAPSRSLEQIEGAGASARKGSAGFDTKARRKVDEDATQADPVVRANAPEASTLRSVTDPTARLDQTNEQVQASQTPTGLASQDHANTESAVPDSGPSVASGTQAASDVHVPETAPMQALSGAHLVQSIHQSEMKLGLNSAEFGSISINTSVTHQVLSAQISLDHPELSRILSAHMPAVEERLGQAYGLQTRVEVRDGSSAQSGARQQGGGSESAGGRQATQFGRSGASHAISSVASASVSSDLARLDVRV